MLKKFIGLICVTSSLLYPYDAKATEVRIALVQGQKNVFLKADDDFKVLDLASGKDKLLHKGKYFARVQDGIIYLEHFDFGAEVKLLALEGKKLPSVNGKNYDGYLQLSKDGQNILATNFLELEKLLCRTLPGKTMPVWPEESIKAQAVAARTYILNQKLQHKNDGFDIKLIDEEVRYAGLGQRVEKPLVNQLIKMTEGQFIADVNGLPIYALSTSSSGGRTESAKEALGKSYSYLQSVKDFDEDSPEYKWDFRISPEYVSELLNQNGFELGKILNVRLSPFDEPGNDRSDSGRVRYIIFGGSKGTAKLSGKRFAELLGLNSECFDVQVGTPAPEKIQVSIENSYGMEIVRKEIPIKVKEKEPKIWSEFMKSYHVLTGGKDEMFIFHGRGKGQGVGLSIWGARALASGENPKNYEEILKYYYPGTHLVK